MTSIAVPEIAGPYVNIFKPRGDRYLGPATRNLTDGAFYDEWVPNDHTFIKAPDGAWHAFGITGPYAGIIHEAEFQSFHIKSPFPSLAASLVLESWTEEPKILRPPDRPGEEPKLYAPCIVLKEDLYYLIYGPQDIRYAVSTDLYRWRPKGTLLRTEVYENDPMILKVDDLYYLYMLHHPAGVSCRISTDLFHWSEKTVVYEHPFRECNCESPFVVVRDGLFYLFWTIWDWDKSHGSYDHRTHVLCSPDPKRFNARDLIARLDAHAPEILRGEKGDWYISSAEWPSRGINLAPLRW
ncbi:MAG: family 43 glycosylhydrolase [Planctomycetota bacterium]